MSRFKSFEVFALVILSAFFLGACTSGQLKARKEQRDKAVQSSRLYCEFVNGELFPDMDVAVNLGIADHCDADGSLSISSYHSPSEAVGMIYCCKLRSDAVLSPVKSKSARADKAWAKSEKAAAPSPTPAPSSDKDAATKDVPEELK